MTQGPLSDAPRTPGSGAVPVEADPAGEGPSSGCEHC